MKEQPLAGTYEQVIIALAERRQRIIDEANRAMLPLNAAWEQVVKDAARDAGLDETKTEVQQRGATLVLVEKSGD